MSAAFPLAVAVVGSRHGSPYGPAQFATAVIAAGGVVVTGCAPGVDQAAAAAAGAAMQLFYASHTSLRVFRAESGEPWVLAKRTGQVIAAARSVAIFPPAGELGPGSALALRLALAQRRPVFFAGPAAPPAPGFTSAIIAGVSGWVRLSPLALF